MLKILVIADDFTGASATGVLIKKNGLNAVSFPSHEKIGSYDRDEGALCINTGTRSKPSRYAQSLVRDLAARYGRNADLVSKRTDSTLRGNVGAEIDGVLEGMGEGYKAVVVPSFPSSGRISVGGYMLVNSIPLQLTGAAKDPKTPVHSSEVMDIIKRQSKRRVEHISLGHVLQGRSHLCEMLKGTEGDIIVVDAVSDSDIDTISKACIMSGIPFVCVDPGPFTASTVKNMQKGGETAGKRMLMMVGSTTELTRKQLDYFKSKRDVFLCPVDIESLMDDFEKEAERVLGLVLDHGQGYSYICITTAMENDAVIDLADAAGKRGMDSDRLSEGIAEGLGAMGTMLLKSEMGFGAIYLSGGDIALGFLRKSSAAAIEIEGEVMPLAVYGSLAGGMFEGLKVVTKGGLVGDERAIEIIAEYVEGKF